MSLPDLKAAYCGHVRMRWCCEKDEGCKKVLRDTYGVCVFGDIFDLKPDSNTAWCFTHNKMCSTVVKRDPLRLLFAN